MLKITWLIFLRLHIQRPYIKGRRKCIKIFHQNRVSWFWWDFDQNSNVLMKSTQMHQKTKIYFDERNDFDEKFVWEQTSSKPIFYFYFPSFQFWWKFWFVSNASKFSSKSPVWWILMKIFMHLRQPLITWNWYKQYSTYQKNTSPYMVI